VAIYRYAVIPFQPKSQPHIAAFWVVCAVFVPVHGKMRENENTGNLLILFEL
jgi:hypothetical protein